MHVCMRVCEGIYFKKLAHWIVGAGKSEIWRADRRLEVDAIVLRQNFFLF